MKLASRIKSQTEEIACIEKTLEFEKFKCKKKIDDEKFKSKRKISELEVQMGGLKRELDTAGNF